ncbi:MAG: hypothetical protein ABEK84_05510, partial [Salinibacter sp.]
MHLWQGYSVFEAVFAVGTVPSNLPPSVMHTERVLPLTLGIFLLVPPAVAQSRLPVEWAELLPWLRDLGILAVGWGTGVTGWL